MAPAHTFPFFKRHAIHTVADRSLICLNRADSVSIPHPLTRSAWLQKEQLNELIVSWFFSVMYFTNTPVTALTH